MRVGKTSGRLQQISLIVVIRLHSVKSSFTVLTVIQGCVGMFDECEDERGFSGVGLGLLQASEQWDRAHFPDSHLPLLVSRFP